MLTSNCLLRMSIKKSGSRPNKLDEVIANARKEIDEREQGYRAKALKMYPWVCGRCSRDFDRSNLQELTVHHRDHNHDNNPEDGSNWELLCLYCHDNEHSRYVDSQYSNSTIENSSNKPANSDDTYSPFAGLAEKLKNNKKP